MWCDVVVIWSCRKAGLGRVGAGIGGFSEARYGSWIDRSLVSSVSVRLTHRPHHCQRPIQPTNSGGSLVAKDALGNDVTLDGWLSTHLPGDRSLVQGLKGDATYLIVKEDKTIQEYGLSAICTHLGCVVPWNKAENKFICPCHASQYDETGASQIHIKPRATGGPLSPHLQNIPSNRQGHPRSRPALPGPGARERQRRR